MNECNARKRKAAPCSLDADVAATIGGVGAVLGAYKGVLAGKDFAGILASAAAAGLACAVVGLVLSLRRRPVSNGYADETAPPR